MRRRTSWRRACCSADSTKLLHCCRWTVAVRHMPVQRCFPLRCCYAGVRVDRRHQGRMNSGGMDGASAGGALVTQSLHVEEHGVRYRGRLCSVPPAMCAGRTRVAVLGITCKTTGRERMGRVLLVQGHIRRRRRHGRREGGALSTLRKGSLQHLRWADWERRSGRRPGTLRRR